MKKKVISVSAILLMLFLTACSKITDNNGSLFNNYDQTTMLTNIGSTILVTSVNNFSTDASSTSNAIQSFTAGPTNNTLSSAQSAFQSLVQSWAAIAPFNFGPMSDNFISVNIDTWPSDTTKIRAAITAGTVAANVGANVKGLKALEYLLFDKKGNAFVLAKYTGSDAANRKQFLNSVIQDLLTQATNLQTSWNSSYLTSFNTAKGNDVSSSIGQLVNAIAIYLDNIKNMKIGNPIGMGVKVNDGLIHSNLIEYTIDEQSLDVMKTNLQAMKTVFDGGSQQGIDDLLNYVNAKNNGQNLSTVIDNQFTDAITKLNAINSPYANAVGNQTQQVQAVFSSLKTLIAYFKVDTANNLGVTITFTDTDGD